MDAQSSPPRPAARIAWQNPAFYYNSWPVDLNRDGRTDIVSSSAFEGGTVITAIGVGDGTFRTPVDTSIPAAPLGTGDFNNDGRVDVVVSGVAILQGNGDGTFAAAHPVTGPPAPPSGNEEPYFNWPPPAREPLIADFNGDGVRDIGLFTFGPETFGLEIYPGLGNFRFGAPSAFPMEVLPRRGMVADFNGDRRQDIVVAGDGYMNLLMNEGDLSFTVSALPFGSGSVTVGDMNRDGRADLVLTDIGYYGPFTGGWGDPGGVGIALGNGNGTFQAPRYFSTSRNGVVNVVIGDFNQDGLLDAATGNRSFLYIDYMCQTVFHYADSISILPGRGDGTLGAAASYRLEDSPVEESPYRDGHNALKTSDFNGDGRTDLLASPGALLLNVPVGTNRPPTVSAGPDEEIAHGADGYLRATATDPDGDWVQYEWRRAGESAVIARTARHCEPHLTGTFTVTARDDRGATATDTVTITEAPAYTPFTGGDVGGVNAAGSYWHDGETYTVRGSGADVWGTADEFYWLHEPHSGDFEIYARVTSVENVDPWTKAGLMIREGTAANARHASLFATPGKGIAFQRRTTTGGASVHTAGPTAAPRPAWLRLKRTGNTISAYHGGPLNWTLIGRQTFTALSDTLEVGLAVSSHRDGIVAEARFDSVLAGDLSFAYRSGDIGAVGVAGAIPFSSSTSRHLEGSGADIWGTADAFRYAFQEWTLDGTLTTRVTAIENTNAWAKAGIMFRESLAANARHVMLAVTPGKGVAMQYRSATGGTSAQVAAIAGTAPEWLRLVRRGNAFTGYVSEDGTTWRTVGSVTVAMSGDAQAGQVVTSHNNSTLATGVFDNIALVR